METLLIVMLVGESSPGMDGARMGAGKNLPVGAVEVKAGTSHVWACSPVLASHWGCKLQ